MSTGRAIAIRLVLTVVVAFMVVAVATVGSLLVPTGGGVAEGPAHPEYAAAEIAPDRLESAGQPDPRGSVGVVLFDRSHGNRLGENDLAPLVRSIDRAGGEVRFTGVSSGLRRGLQEADVLVVVDPGTQYETGEVEAIERFVDDGGRLLLVGEPNRKVVESQGLTVGLTTRQSLLTTVSSPFGISFGSQYVYDMERNDGNFKNVVVSPPDGTDAGTVRGVDQVALYTAAAVEVDRGDVLLRTARSAERANDAAGRAYPVAVRSNGGDVVAVGDKTFLSESYYSVADNDRFIQRLVEFMAGADHRPSGGGNGPGPRTTPTTTPSPTPTATPD